MGKTIVIPPPPPQVGEHDQAPEGRKYIALGHGAWGAGPTPAAALGQCRSRLDPEANKNILVVEADIGSEVSRFDQSVYWETGKKPAFRVAVMRTLPPPFIPNQ